jgi:hypothetical protein
VTKGKKVTTRFWLEVEKRENVVCILMMAKVKISVLSGK